MRYILRWTLAVAAVVLTACADEAGPGIDSQPKVVYPEIKVNVAKMVMTEDSRATEPMSPDMENYIKTLAIFEFDNEGLHDKSSTTYHFIDFLEGTVDGVPGVGDVEKTDNGVIETTLRDIALEAYDNGMVCLVANVTKEQVDTLYMTKHEPGQSMNRLTFDMFCTWSVPFPYEEINKTVYEEATAGHLTSMYMFGYFHGAIDAAAPETIDIDLGRLASCIDMTIVNETGRTIERRLGYYFDNVCNSALFFPQDQGMPPVGRGITRTVICSGIGNPVEGDENDIVPETFENNGQHTRYFYLAAHAASDRSQATSINILYNQQNIIDGDASDDPGGQAIRIPLCNVHPSEADFVKNGYSLSRNTRYRFTIRLRGGSAASKPGGASRGESDGSADGLDAPEVCAGEQPGEYIVYLP